MKIGCLQFAPQVGDVDNNLNRADAILNKANPEGLDILVLPELAFTGYNFRSLRDISPFLEPTGAGITSIWARTTALKHNCVVVVGYPEKVDVSHKWPTSPEQYNSAIIVNQDGDTLGHYRKSNLYYTDETWALEGPGFYDGHIPGVGKVAMGICMDINPYKFQAPWHQFEFAVHVLDIAANVVILSMAWLTNESQQVFSTKPAEPDLDTLMYWVTRLEPLIRYESEEEIIVIIANRTGIEDEAVYAGTSAVLGIQEGEVKVYGLLGRGEKELLVVDTDEPILAKLVYRPDDGERAVAGSAGEAQMPSGDEPTRGGPSSSRGYSPMLPPKPDESRGDYAPFRQQANDESPISPMSSRKQTPLGFSMSTRSATPIRSPEQLPQRRQPTPVDSIGVTRTSPDKPRTITGSGKSMPRNRDGGRDLDARMVHKSTAPDRQQALLSPDLEKLGADLMVFEGDSASRPKRDSLVCHVDEDDYVVLRTERKDTAGKKLPAQSDAHTSRSKSRDVSKPHDSSKRRNGRSHSRNKVSVESSALSPKTGDRTRVRSASRGRRRADSTSSPKHSHGRVTSNGIPLPGRGDIRETTADVGRQHRRQGDNTSAMRLSPIHRSRETPPPLPSKAGRNKGPERAVEREERLPAKTRHRNEDSNHSGAAYTTEKEAAPKAIAERVPPTPKAMVLPPDYDNDNGHRSMPVPPKEQPQAAAVKCLDKEAEARERPRSAVW
ncbi:carbon-nitrogen hydrolase [Durotheca rogersii]|uniref:carbon-nitrogen hydrolase n=1 Tax=Durotheca rogersii TaxID=419775 RepID=UPI00221F8D44|nr:carbon-nitrogen hydrolase [Durotheca rogersii]KAI5865647.1 carbon-nitrogen hydrolase [Durotheca rogersii]